MSRIDDKIEEIDRYLTEIESVVLPEIGLYEKDFKIRAIYERYFEKIVEATADLAFLIIKEKGLRIPKLEKEYFDVLLEEKVISLEICDSMKDLKGMRNVIVHEYGEIDDELVFEAVKEKLIPVVTKFLEVVTKCLH